MHEATILRPLRKELPDEVLSDTTNSTAIESYAMYNENKYIDWAPRIVMLPIFSNLPPPHTHTRTQEHIDYTYSIRRAWFVQNFRNKPNGSRLILIKSSGFSQ